MKEPLKISIDGMHCGACVRRVTDALQGVVGLQLDSVKVGSAQVVFDPAETTAEKIVATVKGIGFHAHIDK